MSNPQIETAELQRRGARLVEREVMACLSSLVSTLAGGFGQIDAPSRGGRANDAMRDLSSLAEQAFELARPIPDYEEAASEAGYEVTSNVVVNIGHYWRPADDRSYTPFRVHETADAAWRECCEDNEIEPFDRDVYEHWAVSSWLADKLEAKGERVDRDFAGLIVWARTTTGQAISIDYVIETIVRETGYASHGVA